MEDHRAGDLAHHLGGHVVGRVDWTDAFEELEMDVEDRLGRPGDRQVKDDDTVFWPWERSCRPATIRVEA